LRIDRSIAARATAVDPKQQLRDRLISTQPADCKTKAAQTVSSYLHLIRRFDFHLLHGETRAVGVVQQLVHDAGAAYAQHAHLLEVIELDTGNRCRVRKECDNHNQGYHNVAVSEQLGTQTEQQYDTTQVAACYRCCRRLQQNHQ
jgi:hypothetical protein